jgi:membrane-bound lytic murein transglycosylase D
MRRHFALPHRANPRIDRQVRWYLSHPKYFAQISERARPYLYFIVTEMERRGIPGEIALLPAVESGFQPFAYSSGRASGIWQFIPSTGRSYGLKQDWWYDGRRDIVASTRAALDYLERLNDLFSGDWELALAAYNAGEGTVSRALRKNRERGRPQRFWALDLPGETEAYVPRLLALARLVADPDAYGIRLEPIPNRPYFATVDVGSQLDLSVAAELAELGIDELYRLNPGLNRGATDPRGPHKLHLPVATVEDFRSKLGTLARGERVRWRRYRIRRGDTLGAIAARHGTSVTDLQESNQLKGTRIHAGKYLLIPASGAPVNGRRANTGPSPASETQYTVRSGDSLWTIARTHRVSHHKLASWNGISTEQLLRPGQRLVIRHRNSGPARLHKVAANRSSVRYQVRKGDSLYSIARRFDISVADLRRWNDLSGRYLQPGQKLLLYLDVSDRQAL